MFFQCIIVENVKFISHLWKELFTDILNQNSLHEHLLYCAILARQKIWCVLCVPFLLLPKVCKLLSFFPAQVWTHPLCFNKKCVKTLPGICNVSCFQIRTGVHQCSELRSSLHLLLSVFVWTSPAQSQQSPVTEIQEGEMRITAEAGWIKTLIQCGVWSVPDLLSVFQRVDFWGWTARDDLVVRSSDLQQGQEPLAFFILLWPLDVEGDRGEGLQRSTHVTDLNSQQWSETVITV